jgi:hypothetical protein
MSESVESDAVEGMSRRHLLKRGVQVGAVAAWTIPIVQVVSMTPAHADSTSKPASGSGSGTGGKTTTKTEPSSITATGTKPSSDLPFTGASVVPAAVVGAGALAVGAGLMAATARKRSAETGENPPA